MAPDTQSPPDSPPDEAQKEERVSTEDEFRQEQQIGAGQQNLTSDNAVPERRPQAFTQPVGTESATSQALKESDDPVHTGEPMSKEAYDKASSDSQRKKAEKVSRVPTIREGDRVFITKEGPFQDHAAVVRSVNYAGHSEEVLRHLGNNESRFATVESIIVQTRDGRSDTIELGADEVRIADERDWGRTAI